MQPHLLLVHDESLHVDLSRQLIRVQRSVVARLRFNPPKMDIDHLIGSLSLHQRERKMERHLSKLVPVET